MKAHQNTSVSCSASVQPISQDFCCGKKIGGWRSITYHAWVCEWKVDINQIKSNQIHPSIHLSKVLLFIYKPVFSCLVSSKKVGSKLQPVNMELTNTSSFVFLQLLDSGQLGFLHLCSWLFHPGIPDQHQHVCYCPLSNPCHENQQLQGWEGSE